MRDNFMMRMGMLQCTREEVAIVAILWTLGDAIYLPWEDVDATLGDGWKPLADSLADKGKIEFEIQNGWIWMAIKYPDRKRRESNRARRQRGKND